MRSASSTDSMKMVHKGPVSFKANAFARILESNDQESTQGGHNTLLRSSIASNCSASGCADFSSSQAASCGPHRKDRQLVQGPVYTLHATDLSPGKLANATVGLQGSQQSAFFCLGFPRNAIWSWTHWNLRCIKLTRLRFLEALNKLQWINLIHPGFPSLLPELPSSSRNLFAHMGVSFGCGSPFFGVRFAGKPKKYDTNHVRAEAFLVCSTPYPPRRSKLLQVPAKQSTDR